MTLRRSKRIRKSLEPQPISSSESEEEFVSSSEADEESDDPLVEADVTPKQTRVTPAKRKSLVSVVLGRSTPTQQLPSIVNTPSPRSDLEVARERLHATSRPASLPCREEEFTEILGYLESAIDNGDGCCICVPGTGKTATVQSVMDDLLRKRQKKTIGNFNYLEINGMKLTEPNQAYSILWQKIKNDKKKISPDHAAALLDKHFATKQKKAAPWVVLIDELDQFITRNQKVIYNFFDWPNRPNSQFIVIAIANTMDLPERVMLNRVSSRIGLSRINFPPYTFQELITIVSSRLQGVECFTNDAIQFCARKVGAVTGDARRALDICRYECYANVRRAIDIAQSKHGDKAVVDAKISLDIIKTACTELFSSPAILSVRKASLHQKLFLAAIVKRLRISGEADTEFLDVYYEHRRLCDSISVPRLDITNTGFLCAQMGNWRWIIIEPSKVDLRRKIKLNMMEEDVVTVLRTEVDQKLKGVFS